MTDSIYNDCWGCKWPGKYPHDEDCSKGNKMAKPTVIEAALEAFWKVVAERHPDITTGDFPPEADQALTDAASKAIRTWLVFNQ